MTTTKSRAAECAVRAVGSVLVWGWVVLCLLGRVLMPRSRAVRRVLVGLLLVVCRVLVALAQGIAFVAGPVDELVTAWLGIAPVLPRVRRWCRVTATEWRAHRVGAIEGEVMDGVWR
nr:hypothetical protein [Kibdelosporangium sp. MJ126-NF4]CEL19688.1 hypothetical protein [Kibdelosporangium sp. MJ126-NF4]CTQ96913.1 hypothetical protein [Kibdelosporangium sp. MJ126-NF4]